MRHSSISRPVSRIDSKHSHGSSETKLKHEKRKDRTYATQNSSYDLEAVQVENETGERIYAKDIDKAAPQVYQHSWRISICTERNRIFRSKWMCWQRRNSLALSKGFLSHVVQPARRTWPRSVVCY